MENKIIEKISEFEEVFDLYLLNLYNLKMKKHKEPENVLALADLFYQKGADLAIEIEKYFNDKLVCKFRKNLVDLHDLVNMVDIIVFEDIITSMKRVFWDIRPMLIELSNLDVKRKIKVSLNDKTEIIVKDYLIEAEKSFNAGAIKASVVMAGAAMEKILRQLHSENIGNSTSIKLYQVMENLEKRGLYKEEEKIILDLCKFFRNFSAHPSELVISQDTAKLIIKSVESFINTKSNG